MLSIDHAARHIPKREYFDNQTQEFITIPEVHLAEMHLKLEHSLRSMATWESRWHKPFVGRDELNGEELLDYIRCMTTNQQKDPAIYEQLTQNDLDRIIEYMQDPYSAWEIRPQKSRKSKKPQTVESIYYAMIQYGVPPEYENWHINRLLSLLDYCDSKGGSVSGAGGPRKKSEREIMEMYRALNEKNRKKYHSKG